MAVSVAWCSGSLFTHRQAEFTHRVIPVCKRHERNKYSSCGPPCFGPLLRSTPAKRTHNSPFGGASSLELSLAGRRRPHRRNRPTASSQSYGQFAPLKCALADCPPSSPPGVSCTVELELEPVMCYWRFNNTACYRLRSPLTMARHLFL